ncbi:MAG: alpha/beta fold hydrolase [Planctomycetia bacterium]|nr:alpha/beta fold hydrolase [Planctomycetia bacterium]
MKLHYEQSGTGDLAIVFGHGFPFDHTMWAAQRAELSKKYRVLTPDFRGMGQSPACPGKEKTTMADLADDLAELLDTLGLEKCVYGGLSMGGYVGWEFWNRHADRLSGLMVFDTNATPDAPDKAAGRRATADRLEKERSLAFLIDGMKASLMLPETIAADGPVLQTYRAMVENNNPYGVAAVARGMAERADFSSRLAEITLPTLVLTGENDLLSPPAMMKPIADALPNADFVVVPHAAHLAPMENPVAVNAAILSFLSKRV